ncbi:hypothetical protein [Saccharopolyspora griseoalba]|uniref:DUF8017 domain-containing protein n=1 Tax=Saccharopolyspora griseoalba TaxID=1431848 RepID=A0ABW2LGE7_9PSEU
MSSPGGPWGPQHHPRQPHGMQYRGFGAFEPPPAPPEPPKRKRWPWLVGLAAAAAVLLAVVTGVAFLATGEEQAEPAPPPPEPAPPTAVSTSADAPLEPGWQVARVPKRRALYDVPPNWRVDPSPKAVHGFGEPHDAVTVTGVATFQRGFCPDQPNSYRATAGVTARSGPDDTAVAAETSRQFIAKAYTRDGVAPIATPGPPEHIRLPGGAPAVRINAEVVLPRPDPCDSPRIAVSVVATNNDGSGSVVLIASADQDIPDAVTPAALDRIGTSLRAG